MFTILRSYSTQPCELASVTSFVVCCMSLQYMGEMEWDGVIIGKFCAF